MDFKAATDVLIQSPSVTLAKIAERFGVQLATIARARIETENRRPAPHQWERVVAALAREHAAELERHAGELRNLAKELAQT